MIDVEERLEELHELLDRLGGCVRQADCMARCGPSKAVVAQAALLLSRAEVLVRDLAWEHRVAPLPRRQTSFNAVKSG
ncbi:MAG: hypothetical protein H0T51_07845 [Pirellulales bacterium]|nr:hypothetical protein [Pirellulales bacterium]